MSSELPFTAFVLPGDRLPEDPVARAAGVPCKALVPVGGVPMVLRVLSALAAAHAIGNYWEHSLSVNLTGEHKGGFPRPCTPRCS